MRSMKLVLFTDNLCSGGAQRQLCQLASEFQCLGHEVIVLTYNSGVGVDGEFFGPWLDSKGIARQKLSLVPRWRRPLELRRLLKAIAPDSLLAFQEASSCYAELAGILGRRWGLVVSERSAIPNSHTVLRWLRLLHFLADTITTNSKTNRLMMARSWTGLGPKVHVIYNAVDLEHFVPARESLAHEASGDRPLRLVVLASHQWLKNLRNVLEGLLHLRDRLQVQLRWYGGTRQDSAPFDEGKGYIQANNLGKEVELLPPTCDARQAYWDSDAVLSASWYEGCPNTICEAMACGKPVLASAVSDNPLLVEDGVTGFLFDPQSPKAIAASILRFADLSLARRHAMGVAGRCRAEKLFDPNRCAKRYEELLVSAAAVQCGK